MINNSQYMKIIQYLSILGVLSPFPPPVPTPMPDSTQQAIITLVNKITSSLDTGDLVIGVFLDLKKAFDTVDHKILLDKMHAYGIRGNILRWFRSYLTNRSQFVSYDGRQSAIQSITCGVHRVQY